MRRIRLYFLGIASLAISLFGTATHPLFGEAAPDFPAPIGFNVPDAPPAEAQSVDSASSSDHDILNGPTDVNPLMSNPTTPQVNRPEHFHWRIAIEEAFEFATVMHLKRLGDVDTLPDSGHGNFFVDYIRSVEGLHGWDDHDRFIIQYIQHSFQGATDARIELQNNPNGRSIEFGDPGYWHSRLVAMAWSGFWGAEFRSVLTAKR